ncbi:DUF2795 domain-containing protein [Burkholderia sp. 4701]|nr:DUF2795 domain-containing protein [Burkholderia sp. 4701]MXN85439.1 DUF2795 domain-containing protein [Burkholderia sp. 4812]
MACSTCATRSRSAQNEGGAQRSHAAGDVVEPLMRTPDREYGTPASVSKT